MDFIFYRSKNPAVLIIRPGTSPGPECATLKHIVPQSNGCL